MAIRFTDTAPPTQPKPAAAKPRPKQAAQQAAPAEAKPKHAGGRPPKYVGEKPWAKEGICRALWYRRRQLAS
jgi:hypothetical protein